MGHFNRVLSGTQCENAHHRRISLLLAVDGHRAPGANGQGHLTAVAGLGSTPLGGWAVGAGLGARGGSLAFFAVFPVFAFALALLPAPALFVAIVFEALLVLVVAYDLLLFDDRPSLG